MDTGVCGSLKMCDFTPFADPLLCCAYQLENAVNPNSVSSD